MSNNNTKMPTRLAYLVCKRLGIITPKECQNVTYAQHMLMAIESLREEKFPINTWTLYYFIEKGIRHCDFFDILYSILLQGNTLEEAINIVIEDYKYQADYMNSEFYDFMFAVGRESQYFEFEKEHNKEEATPNIINWESYLQKNGQTFLIANDDLYAFLEETGFEVANSTPNGRGCSRHNLLLNSNPTLYSVDVYTPFEWYTDHKGNKFEDFESSIGE